MKRYIFLIALAFVGLAQAGPYSDQLRTDPPRTGRTIAEDGTLLNRADDIRCSPVNISRGLCEGAEPFSAFGERAVGGSETNVPIWPDGAIKAAYNGLQMSVVSTSANDAVGGTGVQQLHFHYLDAQLRDQVEIIPMAGLTPVLTQAKNVTFIQCMHIETAGSGAVAAGTVTASNGADIYSQIPAGKTRCSSSFRMVPRGKRLYINGAVGSSVSATADTNSQLRIVSNSIQTHQYKDPLVWVPHAAIGVQNSAISHTFAIPFYFNAGDIVGVTQTTNKAATVSATWFGWLEDAP